MSIFFVCILVLSVSCQNSYIDAAYSVDDSQLLQLDSQNSTPVGSVGDLVDKLLAAVVSLLKNVVNLLTGILAGVVDLLAGVLGVVLPLVNGLLQTVFTLLSDILYQLLVATTRSRISDSTISQLDTIVGLTKNITSSLNVIRNTTQENGEYDAIEPQLTKAMEITNEIKVDTQDIQERIAGNGTMSLGL